MEEQIYKFLIQLMAYGGGASAIAYLLFQHLGKTWLENKFSQRLDELRHQQNIEVQRLRVEIDSLLSGSLRIQEKEFEILPGAWERLDEAYGLTTWVVSPLQQYADVGKMRDTELDEFLADTEFTSTQKQDIKQSRERSKEYQRLEVWRRLQKARIAHRELQAFVARNGILMPLELKEKLRKSVTLLHAALVSKEIGHEHEDWKLQHQGWEKLKAELEPLYQEIEYLIQSRLVSHSKDRATEKSA